MKYKGFDVSEIAQSAKKQLSSDPFLFFNGYNTSLASAAGLYQIGMDLSLGAKDAQALPESLKSSARQFYQDCHSKPLCHRRHNNDGVMFVPKSEAPEGMRQMPNPYVLVRYFKGIKGFEMEKLNGHYEKIVTLPTTHEEYVWLPKGNSSILFDNWFIVPTSDGIYHPVTGTPFRTVKGRKRAIEEWVKSGFTREKAETELSNFDRGREHPDLGQGVGILLSPFFSKKYGVVRVSSESHSREEINDKVPFSIGIG